jgi:hypothetical protein
MSKKKPHSFLQVGTVRFSRILQWAIGKCSQKGVRERVKQERQPPGATAFLPQRQCKGAGVPFSRSKVMEE